MFNVLSTSPPKSECPGVSIMFILYSLYLTDIFLALIVIPFSFSTLVSVKDLQFYVSSENVNKATIKIIMQPTIKAWVKPDLIKNNKIIFQTTISERPF